MTFSLPILLIFYFLVLGLFKQQNVSHRITMLPFRSVLAYCMENLLCSHPSPMPSEATELCNYIHLRMCRLSRIWALEVSFEKCCSLPEMVLLLQPDGKVLLKANLNSLCCCQFLSPWSVSCAGASQSFVLVWITDLTLQERCRGIILKNSLNICN